MRILLMGKDNIAELFLHTIDLTPYIFPGYRGCFIGMNDQYDIKVMISYKHISKIEETLEKFIDNPHYLDYYLYDIQGKQYCDFYFSIPEQYREDKEHAESNNYEKFSQELRNIAILERISISTWKKIQK